MHCAYKTAGSRDYEVTRTRYFHPDLPHIGRLRPDWLATHNVTVNHRGNNTNKKMLEGTFLKSSCPERKPDKALKESDSNCNLSVEVDTESEKAVGESIGVSGGVTHIQILGTLSLCNTEYTCTKWRSCGSVVHHWKLLFVVFWCDHHINDHAVLAACLPGVLVLGATWRCGRESVGNRCDPFLALSSTTIWMNDGQYIRRGQRKGEGWGYRVSCNVICVYHQRRHAPSLFGTTYTLGRENRPVFPCHSFVSFKDRPAGCSLGCHNSRLLSCWIVVGVSL